MNLDKLSKELSRIGNIDGWDKMVKRVALMVLEAERINTEKLAEIYASNEWDGLNTFLQERQSIIKQITMLKARSNGKT